MIADLRTAFSKILSDWRCSLLDFGAESDHAHLLIDIDPALNISTLINHLKTASSRRIRGKYATGLASWYRKPVLWNRAYYIASGGSSTIETVKHYVQSQGKRAPARPPPGSA